MGLKREQYIHILYFIAALVAVVFIHDFLVAEADVTTIPYSQFETLLQQGKVSDLKVGSDHIAGKLNDAKSGQPSHFYTVLVEPNLAQRLEQYHVTFTGEPGPGLFQSFLAWLMPTVGFILLWMVLIRPMAERSAGGLMGIGKSKAKVFVENEVKVRFDDVAGVDEAKEELKEVVSFLKNRKAYERLGAHIPKGVLLVGPPGTGKTLLARAVAGEAGVPFFSISGSEFVEMFVGVGAARVRDLFDQAKARAPAIIFIDELDSLGRARSAYMGGGVDEKEQTLDQLLAEMDGFDPTSGVVLLAATNRPEILDPALLRPGRFDRQILVDRPDRKGRIDILRLYVGKVHADPALKLEDIAGMTPGFTGADLANLVNEAALLATRRGAPSVTEADFTNAVERIVAGLEKHNRLISPREREVVAHHEMGHAIVAMALPNVEPVQKISIIPHGIAALGYTMQRPTEDRFIMDRAELTNRMTVLLGGRASESLLFPEISTGAADDLMKATEIARSMVVRFGMDPSLGPVTYEPEQSRMLTPAPGMDWQPRHYGEVTANAIDTAVRTMVEAALTSARAILKENIELVRQAAAELLTRETLAGPDLEKIAKAVRIPRAEQASAQAVAAE